MKRSAEEDTVYQIKSLKEDVEALKNRKDSLQVDDALSNVRSLASRSKLTSPNVLMAAIETLVEISQKSNHKDSIMYAKAFAICKKYEDSEGFGDLVLKLFGSTEDKKVASVVAEWSKQKKYESEKKPTESSNGNVNQFYAPHGYGPYPYYGFGNFGPGPMMYSAVPRHGPFFGRRSALRGAGRYRKPKTSNCFYCQETGHFVSECPKLVKK